MSFGSLQCWGQGAKKVKADGVEASSAAEISMHVTLPLCLHRTRKLEGYSDCFQSGLMVGLVISSGPSQWSLRDEAHAERFLATAERLRTSGQLVDVSVGPEGDVGPPPHVPLPPGATLRGWRALLAFAYGGTVPQGSEKEVLEAARALGAPRMVAACAPRLESEAGPKPLEEQWETLRAMEQLHGSGLGCDLQLRAGEEVIPGEPGVGVPQGGLRRPTGRSGTARSPDRDAGG
uniref:BTB domain-containing protein n=1 Tax=Athene cunicularia TaxID=194338 RepID=A0A663N4V1_ATHCN